MSDLCIRVVVRADASQAIRSIRRVKRKLWWFRLRWAVRRRLATVGTLLRGAS